MDTIGPILPDSITCRVLRARLIRRPKLSGIPGWHYGIALFESVDVPIWVIDVTKNATPVGRTPAEFASEKRYELGREVVSGSALAEVFERVDEIASGRKPWDYELLCRNCEHLARYLLLGREESEQVQTWFGLALVGLLVLASKNGGVAA
ncbi:MAG: hypothetical protein R3F34_00815 [Planctomycetota bacterium]